VTGKLALIFSIATETLTFTGKFSHIADLSADSLVLLGEADPRGPGGSRVTRRYERGKCPVCLRDPIALRTDGTVRSHVRPDGKGKQCAGSYRDPASA
jgi:hypothetical protein